MVRMGTLELVLLSSLLSLLLGALLARKLGQVKARQVARAHNVRGRKGELAAERMLARHGYTPIARQLRGSYQVQVGEELLEVALHADFLVERAGRTFVAEVKTGRHAPRFEHAETRRQLLEYQLGFAVDSVLLVDVENGQLREVSFPLGRASEPSRAPWLVLVLLVLVGLSWFAIRSGGQ